MDPLRVTFQDKRLHDQCSPRVESGSINSDIHPKSSLLPSVTLNYKISQGKTKIHHQAGVHINIEQISLWTMCILFVFLKGYTRQWYYISLFARTSDDLNDSLLSSLISNTTKEQNQMHQDECAGPGCICVSFWTVHW